MNTARFASLVLRLDAAANAALALGLLVALPTLIEAAGLGGVTVPVVLAAVLLVNAALCWHASRPPAPEPALLRALAGVDASFVIAVAWFVLAQPTAAAAWLRVGLAGLAAVVGVVTAVKLLVASRLPAGGVADPTPARS
jgi:uncharacterized membrane protein (UPF0136 family)